MPLIPSFIRPYITYLEALTWVVWWVSLPFSKGAASVCIVALWILGTARFYDSGKSLWALWHSNKAFLPISFLFFAYIIGLSYTDNLNEGINFTFRQNPFLLVPFIFAFYAHYVKQQLPKHFAWFIAANLFAGFVTIILYKLPEAQAIAFTHRFGLLAYPQGIDVASSGLHSPFIARIQFVNLVALAALAACWLITQAQTTQHRFIWAICLGFLLLISAYLGGRGAQIGLVAAMSVWLFTLGIKVIYRNLAPYIGKPLATIILLSSTLFISIGLPYLAVQQIPEVQKRYGRMRWELDTYNNNTFDSYANKGDFTSVARLISWQKAWEVCQAHPIIGVGTGDYYDEVQIRLNRDNINFKIFAHHQFLQIWAMLGIGGLLLFVGTWLYWLIAIQKMGNFYQTILAISFTFFYIPVCLTDSALITQMGNTGFLLVFCAIALINNSKNAYI